jgi:hypothetical protein
MDQLEKVFAVTPDKKMHGVFLRKGWAAEPVACSHVFILPGWASRRKPLLSCEKEKRSALTFLGDGL